MRVHLLKKDLDTIWAQIIRNFFFYLFNFGIAWEIVKQKFKVKYWYYDFISTLTVLIEANCFIHQVINKIMIKRVEDW